MPWPVLLLAVLEYSAWLPLAVLLPPVVLLYNA